MSDYLGPRVCEVLLVEDNPADARLTREALGESRMLNKLHHVKDGIEALQFLRREGEFHDAPTPDVILLDLNLPRKDGRQVLSEMKQDPELRLIPVVVLTTSEASATFSRVTSCTPIATSPNPSTSINLSTSCGRSRRFGWRS
jgi:chemotaxis family two-component system response regulator Rcp1